MGVSSLKINYYYYYETTFGENSNYTFCFEQLGSGPSCIKKLKIKWEFPCVWDDFLARYYG